MSEDDEGDEFITIKEKIEELKPYNYLDFHNKQKLLEKDAPLKSIIKQVPKNTKIKKVSFNTNND